MMWQIIVAVAAVGGAVLAGVSKFTSLDAKEIETQVKNVLNETDKVKNDIQDKQTRFKSISQSYKTKIYNIKTKRQNVTKETKSVIDDIKKLAVELCEFHFIMIELMEESVNLQIDKRRLDFAIKWLNEEVDIYDKRKNENEDEECKQTFLYGKSQNSIKATNQMTEDQMMIINKLSQALTGLQEAQALNRSLDTQIKKAILIEKSGIDDLKTTLEYASIDKESAQVAYRALKKRKEGTGNATLEMREMNTELKDGIKQDLIELHRIQLLLNPFEEARDCYRYSKEEALNRAQENHANNIYMTKEETESTQTMSTKSVATTWGYIQDVHWI